MGDGEWWWVGLGAGGAPLRIWGLFFGAVGDDRFF